MTAEKKRTPIWKLALLVIAGVPMMLCSVAGIAFLSSGKGQAGALQGIHDQVAADTVAQYEIAKRGGSAIDACVHAGMVAAAYLQAKDESNYQKWKATESADCKAAGMPTP